MDPFLIELLQKMFSQGSPFGSPLVNGTHNIPGPMGTQIPIPTPNPLTPFANVMPQALSNITNSMTELQGLENTGKASRLNTDPNKDIDMYRVNASRGVMKKGGGVESNPLAALLMALMPFTMPGNEILPMGVQGMQDGGMVNNTGYTPGTKSFNNPFNIIPGGNITMKNTPFPIMAIPDNGKPQILQPGTNKIFPGAKSVLELPLGLSKLRQMVTKYQMGGELPPEAQMQMVPVQTEKVGKQSEMIIHLDGTITHANATKPHSKMDDDEVTDILPTGSYITSADKGMKITYDKADKIVIAIKATPYEELERGKVPEEIKLSSLWPNGSKTAKTPAELTEIVLKKFPTMEKDSIFTKVTNQSNINSRKPYLEWIKLLNDDMKGEDEPVQQFKKGGTVRVKDVLKAQTGLELALIPLIGNAIGGIFSSNADKANRDYMRHASNKIGNQYQIGVNRNIRSQDRTLGDIIGNYQGLESDLLGYANQSATGQTAANFGSTALGILNGLGMETDLPELDLGAARSRVTNFRPQSGSRAAVEAASAPRYDSRAIMQSLGARSGPVIAQLESERASNINQAASQRNQFLDQTALSTIGQLNQLDLTELPFNIQQQEKERALREARRNLLTGTLQGGLQRGADIETGRLGQIGNVRSQMLPAISQLQHQRASLKGLPAMLNAQMQMNLLGIEQGVAPTNIGNPMSWITPLAQVIPQLASPTNTSNYTPTYGNNSAEFGCPPGTCPDPSGMTGGCSAAFC